MIAAWTVPTTAGVIAAFPAIFSAQQGQDTPLPATIVGVWLPVVVAQVRDAIGQGNRVPLSLTASSVPPEAVVHVWALTVEACVLSSQRLVSLIFTDGEGAPMSRMIGEARSFLDKCRKGLNVATPTDPVGRDGLTAPGTILGDGSTNLAFADVRYGSMTPRVDLQTPPCPAAVFPTTDIGQP